MARAKVNFEGSKRQIKKFKKVAGKQLERAYREEILKSIGKGVSPVKGQGRFEKYSKSYTDAIKNKRYSQYNKRTRPVNLKLSGKLWKSLKVKARTNKLIVSFDNKLADIHNRLGAGKSKTVRRMLPTEKGEQFNRSIQLRVREVLTRIANNIFKGWIPRE